MKTDYETLKDICSRRKSVRKYSAEKVLDEDIAKILEIANSTPYASGQGKWEVLVIKDPETLKQMADCVKQKVDELLVDIREDFKEHFLNYSKGFTFFDKANVVLVFTFRISPVVTSLFGINASEEIKKFERDNFTKSISCAAMLACLAAESLGLGACYMTGPILAQDLILPIIKAKPGQEIGAVIPIGYK